MIEKRILVPDRVRQPPSDGFSWIDRGFLREHAVQLSHDAIVLYFFLAAVSDKHGLSFYRDTTIAVRLRMPEKAVFTARQELLRQDLIAYHAPLTQVLSMPSAKRIERGGLRGLGEVLHQLQPDARKDD